MTEIWKPIPSQPKYEASSYGRIRHHINRNPLATFVLKNSRSYNYVSISTGTVPRNKNVRVARLIAEAFHGPCPEGLQVDHIDDDKFNDRADNLQYLTQSENINKSYATGKRKPPTWLTRLLKPAEIKKVHRLADKGWSQVKIGKEMGVSNSGISRVLKRRRERI